MNSNPEISIIVPVYNVENYLPLCIDSILSQTYTDFEIILIDDGSTDNSGKICDNYHQKDNRIKVIHQKNSGVTKARANGVAAAHGNFITFVDSDDTIPYNAIYSLYSCISPEIDIIIGKIYQDEQFPLDNSVDNIKSIVDIDTYRKMQLSQVLLYQSGPYAKLFKVSLFNEYILDIPREINMGEDWLMNIRLSFSAKNRICFVNKVVYNYIKRPTSITQRTRTTLKYEVLFYKYYLESIPSDKQNQFIQTTIARRLKTYIEFTGYSYRLPNSVEELYNKLYEDIKTSAFTMSFFVKLLFIVKSPIFRFLIITFRKTMNRFGINIVTIK